MWGTETQPPRHLVCTSPNTQMHREQKCQILFPIVVIEFRLLNRNKNKNHIRSSIAQINRFHLIKMSSSKRMNTVPTTLCSGNVVQPHDMRHCDATAIEDIRCTHFVSTIACQLSPNLIALAHAWHQLWTFSEPARQFPCARMSDFCVFRLDILQVLEWMLKFKVHQQTRFLYSIRYAQRYHGTSVAAECVLLISPSTTLTEPASTVDGVCKAAVLVGSVHVLQKNPIFDSVHQINWTTLFLWMRSLFGPGVMLFQKNRTKQSEIHSYQAQLTNRVCT